MKYLSSLLTLILMSIAAVHAQEEMEIPVPKGWTASDAAIKKGSNELSFGPILELGELSIVDYLTKISQIPPENAEITKVGEIKDGKIVAQVLREINVETLNARSRLFICKAGRNQHRLLELYTEDVFSVISGGKAAIEFCDQP